jgi:hypothetical protein
MAEDRTHGSTVEEIFFNKLKSVDVHNLEQTIAEAISSLVGVELKCSISKINYERVAFSWTSAQFDVCLSEPLKVFGLSETTNE